MHISKTDMFIVSRRLQHLEVAGMVFTVLFGAFLYFLYNLSGGNMLAGFIAPINGSVWENLKTLFIPPLLFLILEYLRLGKNIQGFVAAKSLSLAAGLLFAVSFYYTYSGIIGHSILPVNIATFFISVYITYKLFDIIVGSELRDKKVVQIAGTILLAVMIAAFAIFTWQAPELPLFKS